MRLDRDHHASQFDSVKDHYSGHAGNMSGFNQEIADALKAIHSKLQGGSFSIGDFRGVRTHAYKDLVITIEHLIMNGASVDKSTN